MIQNNRERATTPISRDEDLQQRIGNNSNEQQNDQSGDSDVRILSPDGIENQDSQEGTVAVGSGLGIDE